MQLRIAGAFGVLVPAAMVLLSPVRLAGLSQEPFWHTSVSWGISFNLLSGVGQLSTVFREWRLTRT